MKRKLCSLLSIAVILSALPQYSFAYSHLENGEEDTIPEDVANEIMNSYPDYLQMIEDGQKVDRFIVKPKEDGSDMLAVLCEENFSQSNAVQQGESLPSEYVVLTLEEKVDPGEFMAEIEEYVDFVQPDYELEISSLSAAEKQEESTSNSEKIPLLIDREENLLTAHQISTGTNVVVALIDTGVDMAHPDLIGHFVEGKDFVTGSSSVTAFGTSWGEAHGTHIAGIIAATAPDAKIMPLKVFKEGKAYTSDIISAIQFAEEQGATIVNCSWGSCKENRALRETIQSSNMLFVAAAGNGRHNLDEYSVYPASYPFDNVISVASVNDDGGMSYFSNYGESVDIAAWGRDIVSSIPGGGREEMQGTSMAAAFVTGAAALVQSIEFTTTETKATLIQNADTLDVLSGKIDQGHMINFYSAVSGRGSEFIVTNAVDDFDIYNAPDEEDSWTLFAGHRAVQISVGLTHNVVLREDGTVWAWGNNTYGQLGYNTFDKNYSAYPSQVPGLSDIKYVHAGWDNTIVVKADGTAWAWGQNMAGQLGVGVRFDKLETPTKINLMYVQAAGTNGNQGLFLKTDGSVWYAGCGANGIAGNRSNNTAKYISNPERVQGISNIEDIGLGVGFFGALGGNGDIYVWGNPRIGSNEYIAPTVHLTGAHAFDVGWNNLVAACNNMVYGFGTACASYNNPISLIYESPEGPLNGMVSAVEAGYRHGLILMENGEIRAFGSNALSQLGNGDIDGEASSEFPDNVMTDTDPRFAKKFTNAKAISTYGDANLALTKDGAVYSWGGNIYGQVSSSLWESSADYKANCPRSVRGFGADAISSGSIYLYAPKGITKEFAKQILPNIVEPRLVSGMSYEVPVEWDFSTFVFTNERQVDIYGRFILTGQSEVTNPQNYRCHGIIFLDDCKVNSMKELDIINVEWKTADSELPLPAQVNIPFCLTDYGFEVFKLMCPIEWDTSTYDSQNYTTTQKIYGDIILPTVEGLSNSDKVRVPIPIQVQTQIVEVEPAGEIFAARGSTAKDLELPDTVSVVLLDSIQAEIPVKWNTSTFDSSIAGTTQTLTGTLILPNGITNPSDLPASITIKIGAAIAEVPPCDRIEVRPGTEFDALNLPEEVEVTLADGTKRPLSIDWINTYDKTKVGETQTLFGNLILADGITNPDNLPAQVDVFIRPEEKPIISITPVVVTAKQNYLLGPTDRTHPAGPPPSVAQIPDKVWVNFDDGDRAQLPVVWEGLDSYDRRTPGAQEFTGKVVIDEATGITNKDNLPATLTINVIPESYYVWVGDMDYFPSVTFEVLLGTPVEKLDEILAQEGKKEVPFIGYGSVGAYLFEDVTITGEQPGYDQATPGTYTLTAYLPDNFMDMETGEQGYIPVSVTVLEPSDAVSVETAQMETRQSIQEKYMENIPSLVNVKLENGKTIQSEVEWSWEGYNAEATGIQEIFGRLKNPPAAIKQPISETLEVKLQVNVLPTEYTVAGMENNLYTGDAGLTLEELGAVLDPWVTLNIVSEDGISTKFDIAVTLNADGSDFDPTQAKEYEFTGDQVEISGLPGNITWPASVEKTVTLTTNKVLAEEVAELEPVTEGEGTPFDEVKLPAQVSVRLSCKTADGASKEMLVDIDWGSGEGYTPVPESWDEDGTATFTVTGSLTGCAGYISNAEDMDVSIQIRLTPAPKLLSITPWLFPDSGALEVGVGTTLDEIYEMLGGDDNSHTVRLILEDYLGEAIEEEMTYFLRAEDNTHYDPATATGAIRLNAYLPLGDKIKNPDGLKVQIQISVNQYTITGAEVIRLTRPTGLPFEELDLPEKAMVTRDDGKEEWLDVTWDNSRYNPDRLGMQLLTGTLDTPLPAHLTNPNNIQPKVFLTLTNPAVQILSLTPVEEGLMVMGEMDEGLFFDDDLFFNEDIPGIVEHRYWAEILHEDGTITIEPYSEFEVVDEELKAYITYEEDVR